MKSVLQTPKALGAILVLGALAFVGCASVKVRKVPTPTQYSVWTDQMQAKADKMEGFRFYLPRPFVSVTEPFPIRADTFIADGHVSADGKYVIVESVRAGAGLNDYMAGIKKDTQIPAQAIVQPSAASVAAAKDLVKAQSELIKAATNALSGAPGTTVQTGGTDTSKTSAIPTSPAPPTGVNKRDVHNDNGAFAYQPMRGVMDIAYLPDFEEQYAVSSRSGLGNAQFSINLGQGWSLQGFNSLTDNTELNKRIFDVIDTSIQLAKDAAKTAAGIPPVDISPGITKLITPQSAPAGSAEGNLNPSSPVSLKIVVIHYAAKGLYPVIKPRELQERKATNDSSYLCFDLFRLVPLATPATAFDAAALKSAQAVVDSGSSPFSVPRYPYQYHSFNTFRYMMIEVITADQKPFSDVYHNTGTQGASGDQQKAGVSTTIVAGASQDLPSDTAIAAWMTSLKGKAIEGLPASAASFIINLASYENNKPLKVTLHATPGSGIAVKKENLTTSIKSIAAKSENNKPPSVDIAQVTLEITPADQPTKDLISSDTAVAGAVARPPPQIADSAPKPDVVGTAKSLPPQKIGSVTYTFSDGAFDSGVLTVKVIASGDKSGVTATKSQYQEQVKGAVNAAMKQNTVTDVRIDAASDAGLTGFFKP